MAVRLLSKSDVAKYRTATRSRTVCTGASRTPSVLARNVSRPNVSEHGRLYQIKRSMRSMNERADTLRTYYRGELIFSSNGRWLHPLFEFEDYLAGHSFNLDQITVEDTIVGKAAAILICRLGITQVKAGTLSRVGEAVLRDMHVSYTFERLVDKIFCQTEDLLQDEDDFDQAYALLRERAGKPVR